MTRNWIAVASAEHVRRGGADGFMQVCHGRGAPLRRVMPGDRIAYYSPTITFRGKDKLQAFTRYGIVRTGAPYQVDMGEGFCPFRRDVDWATTHDAPIAPLLETLEFTRGKRNWGAPFRYGIFAVSDHDMDVIARAMGAAGLAAA
ncbi:MAG TPA: EVE domain-containing protein [Stellaceae bacterium]|nr:EVE domain-containing protein [Stellaceae bacterium]